MRSSLPALREHGHCHEGMKYSAGLRAMGFAITGHVKGESVAGRRPCDMDRSAVSFLMISRENSCTPRSTLSTASSAYKERKVDG
jgi:hypothetical protein